MQKQPPKTSAVPVSSREEQQIAEYAEKHGLSLDNLDEAALRLARIALAGRYGRPAMPSARILPLRRV